MTSPNQPIRSAIAGPLGWLLWTLLMAGMSVGCSGEDVVYEGLHLWITSEEPATHVRINRIEITVRDVDDDGGVHLFEGLSEQDHEREILLAEQHNIYESPYKAKFVSGEIIRGILRMTLTGFHGDQAISFWSGNVSLNENYKLEVHLSLVGEPSCVEDADCNAPTSCQLGICEDDGHCIFAIKDEYCLVDGACYLAGSVSESDLCNVCDPAQSTTALVAVTCPEDTVCDSEKGCVPIGIECQTDDDCLSTTVCISGQCDQGKCIQNYHEGASCDDGVPCTLTDVCDSHGACAGVPDNNECDNDNLCDGDEICDSKQGCLSGTPFECDDDDVCTTDTCKAQDCVFAPIAYCCNNAGDCDDAKPCTLNDCVDHACHFSNIDNCCSKAEDCDDATNCTVDTCKANQCVNDSTNCCVNVTDCPSPKACEKVTCSSAGDCEYQTQSVCTPGATQNQYCGQCGTQTQVCTDQCNWGQFGACQGQGPCSFGQTQGCGLGGTQSCTEACTWAACEGEGVCANGDTQPCGNCGQLTCSNNAWGTCTGQGSCSPDQTLSCGQCGSKVCTANCQWLPCQPDDSLCNDSNPCTNDACVPTLGCVNDSVDNGTSCEPGKTCQSGVCTQVGCTGNADCWDSKPCTKNICANGECKNPNKNDGFPCDDGFSCTTPDQCLDGECTGGPVLPGLCLFDEVCYIINQTYDIGCSACDPTTSQTSPTPLNSGNECITCPGGGGHCGTDGACALSLDCDDGDAETTGDECVNGVCTGTPVVKVDNQTCNTIKNTDPGATSGVYTIDTDKDKKNKPFQAYCDMTTQGGGWTLVWKQRNHDDAVTLNKPKLKGSALLLSESYDGTTQGSIMGAVPHGETLFKHSVTIWIHVEESILDWSKINSGPSNKRTCRNIGETTHACEGIDCSIYKHVFLDRTDPPMKSGQVSGIIIGPFHDNYGTGDWLQCGEVWCHPEKHGRFDEDCTDGTPDGKGDWMIFVR